MGECVIGVCGAGVDGGASHAAGLGRESEGEESVYPGGEVLGLISGSSAGAVRRCHILEIRGYCISFDKKL